MTLQYRFNKAINSKNEYLLNYKKVKFKLKTFDT